MNRGRLFVRVDLMCQVKNQQRQGLRYLTSNDEGASPPSTYSRGVAYMAIPTVNFRSFNSAEIASDKCDAGTVHFNINCCSAVEHNEMY